MTKFNNNKNKAKIMNYILSARQIIYNHNVKFLKKNFEIRFEKRIQYQLFQK